MKGSEKAVVLPVRTKEAAEYLEKKYQGAFTLFSSEAPSIDQMYSRMVFFPTEQPNRKFSVYDDYRQFADNYFGVLAEDRMQALLDCVLREICPEAKTFFFFRSHAFPAEFVDPAKLTCLLEEKSEFLSISMYSLFPSWFDLSRTVFDELCGKLKANHITAFLSCYSFDANDIRGLDTASFRGYLSQHIQTRPKFTFLIQP